MSFADQTDIPTLQQRNQAINNLLQETPGLWRASSSGVESSRNTSLPRRAGQPPYTADLFADADGISMTPDMGRPATPTGFRALDELLPAQGWPERGLIEMVCAHTGIGELQILLPLLRARSQQSGSILWIAPPYPLNTPALQQAGVNTRNSFVIPSQTSCNQALWSIEKALQSAECGLVLAWQNWLSARVIRRLQLAASEGSTLGVLFHRRPTTNSPASLQLHLRSPVATISQSKHSRAIEVLLTRARGPYRPGRVTLPLP